MCNIYKFIFSNKEYYLLFNKKKKTPNLEKRLNEIKEFKSKFQKFDCNDLKLLKADVESKVENNIASGLSEIVIGVLIGAILNRASNASVWETIFLILMVILLGIIGVRMIIKKTKMLFIKKMVDICFEERVKSNNKDTRR